MTMDEQEKQCGACGEWWPLDEDFWYRKQASKDGFESRCKACVAEVREKSVAPPPVKDGDHKYVAQYIQGWRSGVGSECPYHHSQVGPYCAWMAGNNDNAARIKRQAAL